MSEERILTEKEILARKIAMAEGGDIDRLILLLKKQEYNDPDFQQYLKEKEAEWKKK